MTASVSAEAVRAERIRDLFLDNPRQAYAALGVVALIAVANVALLWSRTGGVRALAWLGAILSAQVATAVLIHRFHRAAGGGDLGRWGRRRTVIEAAHGFAWALAVPLLHQSGEVVSLILVLAMVVGLAAAMAASLAVYLPAMMGFVMGALLPAAAFFLWQAGGGGERFAALSCAVSTLLVSVNALRMSAVYEASIRARLALAARMAERQALQEAAEAGRAMAEAAAAERTRFFGAASHDLRQPVHALGMYATVLNRDPPKAERKAIIASIAACVESLDQLFSSILGVAQAADPARGDRALPFALAPLIDRVLVQFRPEAERRGLRLRARPTDLWVCADPSAVERILSNYVANAVRHTARGGVLIGARRRGADVELGVFDTGPGLAPADQARIFDPFVQLASPAGGTRGFGLGLATVRELGLAYSYPLSLASRLGRGSSFRVRLPGQLAPVAGPGVADPGTGTDTPPVLLVEDDPLVTDAVTRLLAAWGVPTRTCTTGEAAIDELRRDPSARWHVLVDYRLGGAETGLDVADRLRAVAGDSIALTLLTGEADPAIFDAARARGMLTLQKPLRPIQLRALLSAGSVGGEVARADA